MNSHHKIVISKQTKNGKVQQINIIQILQISVKYFQSKTNKKFKEVEANYLKKIMMSLRKIKLSLKF